MYFIDMYTNNWIIAEDPQKLKQRIELKSLNPLLLFVAARKIEDVNIFGEPPLQSDYRAAWENNITLKGKLKLNNKQHIIKSMLKKMFPKHYNILHILRSKDEYIL